MELLLVVLGGLLAIAGGVLGHLIESWLRRKNARNDLIAEREVDACAKSYRVLKAVVTLLDRPDPDFPSAAATLHNEEAWFWENRLWLPGRSPDAWLGCRNAVHAQDKEEAIAQADMD